MSDKIRLTASVQADMPQSKGGSVGKDDDAGGSQAEHPDERAAWPQEVLKSLPVAKPVRISCSQVDNDSELLRS